MTTLKQLLPEIHKNLETLLEKEALYGGRSNAPLELRNQIDYHEAALERIEAVLSTPLTETVLTDLKADLKPLLLLNETYQHYLDELKPEIPPLKYEPETILIPSGPFLMGSQPGEGISIHETPQCEIDLPAYQIGKYPVTVEQYAEFIKQTDHPAPRRAGWFGKNPPNSKLDHPVVGVSWYDALAYCHWLSDKTGRPYRLPTEAEWEKAARGTDGRLYPWGNEWDASRCNCTNSTTTAVTAFPAGQSLYGCYDMIGNVWEWTSTFWGSDWQTSDFPYPYRPDDGREALSAAATVHRVFRGGDFDDDITQLKCSARRWYAPDHADKARGFRVVLDVWEFQKNKSAKNQGDAGEIVTNHFSKPGNRSRRFSNSAIAF